MTVPARIEFFSASLLRLIVGFVLSSIFYLLFSISPVHAQNPSINSLQQGSAQAGQAPNPYLSPNTNPDVPQNLHTWTQSVMIEVSSALICQLIGIDPTTPYQKCLGIDTKTGKIGFVENGGGLIGMMGSMIAVLYTPPVHTSDYVQYLASNFGFAKPAYAQGVGFQGISPLAKLWTAFRNIVYLLFVIVFILIGLAIMLRIHIDPRTVMSIENQIPKMVIGIILVTFSFAIAGLVIDMMWLGTYVGVNVIAGVDPPGTQKVAATVNRQIFTPPIGFVNEIYNEGVGGVLNLTARGAGSIKDIIGSLFQPKNLGEAFNFPANAAGCKGFDPVCWFSEGFTRTLGDILSTIFGWAISWIFGILGFLVILIAVLFALFRLWFELVKSYIMILLDVVLAPFWIVAGLVPGSPIGFGAWFRDIVADLSAFPTTIVMFMLGKVFMDSFSAAPQGSTFIPPLIGNPGDMRVFGPLIALGIIWLTPSVVTMVRAAIKAPEFKYGTAIGQALGSGMAAPTRLGGGGASAIVGQYDAARGMYVYKNQVMATLGKVFGVNP